MKKSLFSLTLNNISSNKKRKSKSLLFSSHRYNLLYYTNNDEYYDKCDLTLMRESYKLFGNGIRTISRYPFAEKYKYKFRRDVRNYNISKIERCSLLFKNSISIYNYYHPHTWINNS